MEIRIVTTSYREQHYVDQMMATIGKHWNHKRIWYPDWGYKHIPNHETETIRQDHPNVLNVIREWEPQRRGAYNYRRALAPPLGADVEEGVLILEDDIIFAKDWFNRFMSIRQSIKAHRSRFLITLYNTYPLRPDSIPYVLSPRQMFGGTQAVYYPPTVRAELADVLHNVCIYGGQIWDHAIRDYCDARDITIFIANPNLVQHIGTSSTLGAYVHTSPNFEG